MKKIYLFLLLVFSASLAQAQDCTPFLPSDYSIGSPGVVQLNAQSPWFSTANQFMWSNGENTAFIYVYISQTTTLGCTISDGVGSCIDLITITVDPLVATGCTNPVSCNYNSNATVDDGSCFDFAYFYPDLDFDGYGDPNAQQYMTCTDGFAAGFTVTGSDCYDADATFSPVANTCHFGCTYDLACNFNPSANINDGSCTTFYNQGFTGPFSTDQFASVTEGNGSIVVNNDQVTIYGSNESGSSGSPFNRFEATFNSPQIITFMYDYSTGDENASYDQPVYTINGVSTPLNIFSNPYNGLATVSIPAGATFSWGVQQADDCCGQGVLTISNLAYMIPCILGCNEPFACNYYPEAMYNDGSCSFYMYNGGFTGPFDLPLWSVNTNGGGGTANIDVNTATITGSDNQTQIAINTELYTTATFSGNISFHYAYTTNDDAPMYDIPQVIAGTNTTVLVSNDAIPPYEGDVTIHVNQGEMVSIGILSVDDLFGSATLVVSNFAYTVDCALTGCTDNMACNYNGAALYDDGSCYYMTTYYLDADNDYYAASMLQSCVDPGTGYTIFEYPTTDCDDNNPNVNPGMAEIEGNNIDDDCNGFVDGIEEISQNTFQVYPNPSAGMITIQFQSGFEQQVRIYDMVGQLVMKKRVNKISERIDCSTLANGTYVVKVGEATQLLVIEHE